MALITIQDLTIGFRGPNLLDEVSCRIEAGQRIGLLGRNGAGKTTFMRMLCGQVDPDDGQIVFAPNTRLSLLPQDVPSHIQGPIASVVQEGYAPAGDDVVHDEHDRQWRAEHAADQLMSRMKLDADALFESLSSGMKRRVLLAQALVSTPDVLLLDEPTNHLDIDSIRWLEEFLSRWSATLIFVTHDRMFLRQLATRILEIDRGRIFDWSCDYDTFLQRKEADLAATAKQEALFDKKLAEEEKWIRQGIKARRTRNEGRVRALKKLREQRGERRESVGRSKLQIQEAQRSGNLVAELKDVSFSYDGQSVFENFSTMIMRSDKVGLIGPNGAGKTTLLKTILGKLEPQSGSVKLGTNLQVAYFDQLRHQLDENKTVQENVGDGYQTIKIGETSKHVLGYLQDFLFNPERARTEVRFLSGGERNRILLAKLFAKPANVIVLDEPTNDLDAETLELLEERLVEFAGTVLLVSHDREFLNNVVTHSIVFEENGLNEYVGGYDDWLRVAQARVAERAGAAKPKANKSKGKRNTSPSQDKPPERRKLTFKEQQELQALPAQIETMEQQIQDTQAGMADPEFYKKGGDAIAAAQAELAELQSRLAEAYSRWEELDDA